MVAVVVAAAAVVVTCTCLMWFLVGVVVFVAFSCGSFLQRNIEFMVSLKAISLFKKLVTDTT